MRPIDLLMFAVDLSAWSFMAIIAGVGLLAAAVIFIMGRYTATRDRATEEEEINLNPRPEPGDEPPDQEEDVALHGGVMDRRRALRRGGNPVIVLISDAEGKAEPAQGWVLDRSTGGLCLGIDGEIPAGAIISVRAANAPPTIPWVQLEVRNCRAVGKGEYELGCKFLKTPPWNVLLLFG
jgi:hypothetical protein